MTVMRRWGWIATTALAVSVVVGGCGGSSSGSSSDLTPSGPATTVAAAVTPGGGGAAVRGVTAGAFCSPEGTRGQTNTGKAMVCRKTGSDDRARWRAE